MSVEITLRDYKEIMPLELLTDEDKARYFEWASWSWVQAIYILKGYKPPFVFEFENENAKYHFPNETIVFGDSRNYLSVGCKVVNAGITTYYDSPQNWQVFWRVHYPQSFYETQTTTAPPVTPKELTKLEKQHDAILEVIKLKGFEQIKIPDGEKGTIEAICRADYQNVFDAESSFNTAWKKGVKKGLFRMANHASYSKRGRE